MSKISFYTLKQIADKIGADVYGDENCQINSLSTLASAQSGQVAFLANPKYRSQLTSTKASAVILSDKSLSDFSGNALVMKNPYVGFALTAQLLDTTPAPAEDIHISAVVDESATIGKNVSIGANAVISCNAVLADGAIIGAGCVIGKSVSIGSNTKLWANVTVYHNVVIGSDCLIQSGCVVGSDGFGYANDKGQWIKIPQLGSVIIGNNVEIGANTTIDRGALDNTEIYDGVIIDNQVQIAHNVVIGSNTCIAGNSAIAGSTSIGKSCIIGGGVVFAGHLTIADKSTITGNTMVVKSIQEAGVYSSGMPAMPNREWLKNNARINKLEQLTKQVKDLTAQLQNITDTKG
jgi:UDP-3-O-[3-hydroxymyristoyl] glucosamine N-acyltransferase